MYPLPYSVPSLAHPTLFFSPEPSSPKQYPLLPWLLSSQPYPLLPKVLSTFLVCPCYTLTHLTHWSTLPNTALSFAFLSSYSSLFIASVFVLCRFFLDFGYIAWHWVLARSLLIFSAVLPLLDPVSSLLHCRRLRQFLQFLCRCCCRCRCCRCLLFVVSFCAVLWTLHFFLTLEFHLLGPLPDACSLSLSHTRLSFLQLRPQDTIHCLCLFGCHCALLS